MSRRLLVSLLIVLVSLVFASALQASQRFPRWVDLLRPAASQVILPAEWDGVWVSVDSTYDCDGTFQSVSTNQDTLCAGQDLNYNVGTYNVTCSGSATATTADLHCTGSSEVIPDCAADLTLDTHVALSGDTYFSVTTVNVTYSGTALGCNLFPASCTTVRSHATRTGPAPPAYCLTPTRASTWGNLKIRYR